MEAMERTEPQMFKDLMKEFIKDRQRVTTASAKVKFSIQEFKATLLASSGTRRGGEPEMMWKGHWLDEAKTARHGYLTKEEAESKWDSWLADSGVARDNEGPRRYLRLAVPARDTITAFEELARQKELQRTEKLSRTASEETVDQRVQMILQKDPANGDPEAEEAGEAAAVQGFGGKFGSHTWNSLSQKAAGAGLEDLAARDLHEMAAEPKQKQRLKKAKQAKAGGGAAAESEDGDTGSPSSEGEGHGDGSAAGSAAKRGKQPAKEKRFDAETKCRKAERAWVTGVEALEQSFHSMVADSQKTLADFRADSPAEFSASVLEKRARWLQACLEGCTAVEALIAEADKEAEGDSVTTSGDLTALQRVGPCKDFKELKSLPHLMGLSTSFLSCASQADTKAQNEQNAAAKKHLLSLPQGSGEPPQSEKRKRGKKSSGSKRSGFPVAGARPKFRRRTGPLSAGHALRGPASSLFGASLPPAPCA